MRHQTPSRLVLDSSSTLTSLLPALCLNDGIVRPDAPNGVAFTVSTLSRDPVVTTRPGIVQDLQSSLKLDLRPYVPPAGVSTLPSVHKRAASEGAPLASTKKPPVAGSGVEVAEQKSVEELIKTLGPRLFGGDKAQTVHVVTRARPVLAPKTKGASTSSESNSMSPPVPRPRLSLLRPNSSGSVTSVMNKTVMDRMSSSSSTRADSDRSPASSVSDGHASIPAPIDEEAEEELISISRRTSFEAMDSGNSIFASRRSSVVSESGKIEPPGKASEKLSACYLEFARPKEQPIEVNVIVNPLDNDDWSEIDWESEEPPSPEPNWVQEKSMSVFDLREREVARDEAPARTYSSCPALLEQPNRAPQKKSFARRLWQVISLAEKRKARKIEKAVKTLGPIWPSMTSTSFAMPKNWSERHARFAYLFDDKYDPDHACREREPSPFGLVTLWDLFSAGIDLAAHDMKFKDLKPSILHRAKLCAKVIDFYECLEILTLPPERAREQLEWKIEETEQNLQSPLQMSAKNVHAITKDLVADFKRMQSVRELGYQWVQRIRALNRGVNSEQKLEFLNYVLDQQNSERLVLGRRIMPKLGALAIPLAYRNGEYAFLDLLFQYLRSGEIPYNAPVDRTRMSLLRWKPSGNFADKAIDLANDWIVTKKPNYIHWRNTMTWFYIAFASDPKFKHLCGIIHDWLNPDFLSADYQQVVSHDLRVIVNNINRMAYDQSRLFIDFCNEFISHVPGSTSASMRVHAHVSRLKQIAQ